MNAIIIMLHVCCAIVALLSGFMAMSLRKGSNLHAAAGTVFSTSMLLVASAGTYMAVFIKPNKGNVMGGVLVLYLVATGWAIARRRERKTGIFDWAALLGAFAIAAAAMTWGIQAAASHTSSKDGYPAGMYFFFGSIALLFAFSDVRMIVRGGVSGSQRIARHLWRMSLALLFALVSFYPSRARLFPQWVNDSKFLYVPHVLLIGAMFLYLVRVRARKRVPQEGTKSANAIEARLQRVA